MFDKEVFSEFEIPFDEPLFPTGVVSRLLEIPPWVLKRLDSEGIVSPDRGEKKDRLYSQKELKMLRYVWYLMEQRGVKMNGIKVILEIRGGNL